MDKFVIKGGSRLQGEVRISGSKNSALPALAAALLTDEPVTLRRIPRVRDIRTMQRLLVDIGSQADVEGETVRLHTPRIVSSEAPYELVKTMRASSLVLGPLVARTGRARVSLPGGCAIGARPINMHLLGLEQLGARIQQSHGYIEAEAPDGLRGATIHFDRITVTGTEDLIMAAVLARGETMLRNAAREPEVADLCALLSKMGARIEGAGTSTIHIAGVEKLHGADHTIISDRIEAGTFLIAGAITAGDLKITDCVPEHVGALVAKLLQAGAELTQTDAAHHPHLRAETAPLGGCDDRRISGLRDRFAGAIPGVDDAGARHRDRGGNDFRKSLHARPGAGADGREYPAGRPAGDRGGALGIDGRGSHCVGSARERFAGAGGAGGARGNGDRSCLPHRPRL